MASQAEQAAKRAQEWFDIAEAIRKRREDREAALAAANSELVDLIEHARGAATPWPVIAEAMDMTPNGVRHFIRSRD